MKELKHRLEGRMSNSAEDMNRRLQRAVDEIKEYKMYDYVIVNDIIKNFAEETRGDYNRRKAQEQ